MPITFSCPRCGARFDVSERLAGKKGRCTKCGHQMSIPAPSLMVAASGMFRLRPDPALAGLAARPMTAPPTAKPAESMLPSNAALAPLTEDVRPVGFSKRAAEVAPNIAAYLQESTSGTPYVLVEPKKERRPTQGTGGQAAGALTWFYRGQVGNVLAILRKLSDFAYLISIPFILILLVGIVTKSRSMALGGAAAVILLNIGRFATSAFAFYVKPFKKSPVEGLLFLVPPYTVYYVTAHWKAMKKSTMRLLEPALTIGLVVAAFLFIPWLRSGTAPEEGTIRDRLRAEAGALKSDLRDEVEGRGGSIDETLGGLAEKAQSGLEKVKGAVNERREARADENPTKPEAPR